MKKITYILLAGMFMFSCHKTPKLTMTETKTIPKVQTWTEWGSEKFLSGWWGGGS